MVLVLGIISSNIPLMHISIIVFVYEILKQPYLQFPITALCDEVCQRCKEGLDFPPGTLVSSINITDRHDINTSFAKHQ
jgi:hypothetical protein